MCLLILSAANKSVCCSCHQLELVWQPRQWSYKTWLERLHFPWEGRGKSGIIIIISGSISYSNSSSTLIIISVIIIIFFFINTIIVIVTIFNNNNNKKAKSATKTGGRSRRRKTNRNFWLLCFISGRSWLPCFKARAIIVFVITPRTRSTTAVGLQSDRVIADLTHLRPLTDLRYTMGQFPSPDLWKKSWFKRTCFISRAPIWIVMYTNDR